MRILTAGGGSGGHVTPVRAVLSELNKFDPDLEALFICDKAFEVQSRGIMEHSHLPVRVRTITAGKFRRYHGISLAKQLLDIPTVAKNLVDLFKIAIGLIQSLWILFRFKPDVVFAKGGFVCLPVGFAAKLSGVPLVIHDSDTRPGLTNSLLGRFASHIATGSPLENYSYDPQKSSYVGVPIDPEFHPFSAEEQRQAKYAIGVVDPSKALLVVTGGGLGAQAINDAVVEIGEALLDKGFEIYHVTGKKHARHIESHAPEHALYHVVPFVYERMSDVLGAADIVISRASATFLQELASLAKPAIVIPAKHLGDQVKNAEVYKSAQAALVLTDDELRSPQVLFDAIISLRDDTVSSKLADNLHDFARPDAALDTARIVVDAIEKSERVS